MKMRCQIMLDQTNYDFLNKIRREHNLKNISQTTNAVLNNAILYRQRIENLKDDVHRFKMLYTSTKNKLDKYISKYGMLEREIDKNEDKTKQDKKKK